MLKNYNPDIKRQVILDTETTGMNKDGTPHYQDHCIIEIGAVEVINRRLTGRIFHVYIKPTRPVDPEAVAVHGLTDEMLADKPSFAEIAPEFLHFIEGAELIIHNAAFDIGFIDYEFSKLPNNQIKTENICQITDSLALARQMYPGKRNNLDALCDRLGIDNSKRTLHGALLDAEILADVYLTMTGGQVSLFSEDNENATIQHNGQFETDSSLTELQNHKNLTVLYANPEEQEAHQAFLEKINKKSKENCIWLVRLNSEQKH
ncbi:DNA polymerase III subunit epsilon [Mergibacter septicus]|uniref:DNA polymerase III subunit epsilon n=1 Tax=Mergibacter septicus TaxID=221402 RepID=UPI00117983FC|nr:DNA polymerase III subunit epsilon [Mergibacter septicus]AWX13168.1 DNA polymerase III subunit epsilon [Mergibacter septicus]